MKINQIDNDCSLQLINELGKNIQSIQYNKRTGEWIVKYEDGLQTDIVDEDDFLEYLRDV